MFQKILVPVDGSPTSMSAIDTALGIAKAFDSSVAVVYVIDPYPFTGVGADFACGQDQYLNAAKTEAAQAVDTASRKFADAGITVETRIAEAYAPWRGILEAATETGADLIVMGSHGRRGLEKLMLGSVAQSVLARTKLNVLIVRSEPDADKKPN